MGEAGRQGLFFTAPRNRPRYQLSPSHLVELRLGCLEQALLALQVRAQASHSPGLPIRLFPRGLCSGCLGGGLRIQRQTLDTVIGGGTKSRQIVVGGQISRGPGRSYPGRLLTDVWTGGRCG